MGDGEFEFQGLHRMFRPKVLRYLRRLVGDYEAEDLTQEVFLKVSQALGKFQGRCQLSTWIYRIATHAAFDRLRRPSFKRMAPSGSVGMADDDEGQCAWSKQKPPSIETALVHREMNDCA